MAKNWHHFSAKQHREFLLGHGFHYSHTNGSHEYYVKKNDEEHHLVQVVNSTKERKRQSRKTMDMSSRHSSIPKLEYREWIN